jgi:hypothetical protein
MTPNTTNAEILLTLQLVVGDFLLVLQYDFMLIAPFALVDSCQIPWMDLISAKLHNASSVLCFQSLHQAVQKSTLTQFILPVLVLGGSHRFLSDFTYPRFTKHNLGGKRIMQKKNARKLHHHANVARMTYAERLFAGCRTNPRAGPCLEQALRLTIR